MVKSFLVLLFLMITMQKVYADMNTYFQQGLDTAAAHQNQATQAIKSFNPNITFNNYDPKPSETKYYKGGTQTNTTLAQDAAGITPKTEVGSTINQSYTTRPQFNINIHSPAIQKGILIQNNATDIVNGISNDFVDCNKKQSCTTTYENKTCEVTPANINQYCKQTLVVTMVPKEQDIHYKFTAHLLTSDHTYAAIIFNLVTGQIIDKGPHDASGALIGRLPSNSDCRSLHGTVASIHATSSADLNYIYFPSCSNGPTLNYKITTTRKLNVDMDIDIVSNTITQMPEDHWQTTCAGFATNTSCVLANETCLEANTTHAVDGTAVTRACWEKEDTYSCRGGELTNACRPLIEQGCEQVGSECTNMTDGGCSLYNQTYRCPIKTCADNGVICNGETYCLTDDCISHSKMADPDFQKAVSSLSAVDAASHEFDQESTFTGTPKSCSSEPLGFSNCC